MHHKLHDFESPAIRGECHLANAVAIEEWLAIFDVEPLDIDLSGVTFFDSAALGVVLNAVRSQGGGYYGRNIKAYYEYQNGHEA